MTKREKYGTDVLIPFQCNYCGKYLCEGHRLIENRDCTDAPARTLLGSYQTKQLIASVQKTPN